MPKIRVEIWPAAATLHEAGVPTFAPSRLVDEVGQQFGGTRPGVMTHAAAHCVASARKNTGIAYNYLTMLDSATYRLWRPGDDIHPERLNGRTHPDLSDIPAKHIDLWRRWAS